MNPRILLVEDTPDIALWLGTALRQGGMAVEFATDGHEADRCLQAVKQMALNGTLSEN